MNVDKTREFIAAYNRRDFDAAIRDFHPQVEWILPALQRSDSAIGPAGVIRFWEAIDDDMEELQLLPQEFRDAGDVVAVRLRHYGVGVMVRIEYFESWDAALDAAGLKE